MEKLVIERFINKYAVGGAIDMVRWVSGPNGLSVRGYGDNNQILAEISTSLITLPDGEYAVLNTGELRSLLGILDDNIEIEVKMRGTRPFAFEMKDGATKVRFGLGEPVIVPKVPDNIAVPHCEIWFKLDRAFATTFIKAQAALSDAETFAVLSDGKSVQVVLGHNGNANTNQVSIDVGTVLSAATVTPTKYDAKVLRAVLTANKEAEEGLIRVSTQGLAVVSFDLNGWTVVYYLPAAEN